LSQEVKISAGKITARKIILINFFIKNLKIFIASEKYIKVFIYYKKNKWLIF